MATPRPFQRLPLRDEYPDLFGPDGKPIPAALRESSPTQEVGEPLAPRFDTGSPRAYEVRVGQNLATRPRDRHTPFESLRALGEFDLVRIAIEDVKGQILGMDWSIDPKPEFKDDDEESLKTEIDLVKRWIDEPDPTRDWEFPDWLGSVLEDILVVDALTLFPRFKRNGDPIGLEQTDGTTIKVLTDERGRPPMPPATAYQQVIRGQAERAYTFGELWYLPRNRRTPTPYGRSPVEQVMITVNIAIRAHLHELSFYRDGNLPDSLYQTPQEWTPAQIDEFQLFWDNLTQGRSDRRSGLMRFLPGGPGTGYIATKDKKMVYEYLEWLARVIAWSFGVSPMPVAKVMNRATAEALEQSTAESGVKPVAKFVARVVNRYIKRVLRAERVEFRWGEDETEDSTVAYQRNVAYVKEGILGRDEVRGEINRDPMGIGPTIQTAAGVVFVDDLVKQKERAETEDQATSGFDPSRLQRAFLEVPILRRDELRTVLGLTPLGGEEGQEFVVIAQQGPGGGPTIAAPIPEQSSSGETPLSPSTPEAGADDSALPIPDEEIEARARGELRKWRRMALGRVRRGVLQRVFASRDLPVITTMRIARGLADAATADAVREVFKAEGTFTEAQKDVEARLRALLVAWMGKQMPAILTWAKAELAAAPEKIRKQGPPPLDTTDLFEGLTVLLDEAAQVGADDTLGMLAIDLETPSAAASLFAQERSAELVGMKWVDGALVENPNPQFAITETIRTDIQNKVTVAIESGWSPQQLTSELQDIVGTGRAETIARTETGFAYNAGAQEVYDEAGIEHVKILDGAGCLPRGHQDGAPQPSGSVGVVEETKQSNGQIWTLAQFRANPLGHPNCVRASVAYFGG